MSSTTSSTSEAMVRRPNLINSLFPSVVSGIVLGVVGAAASGVLVNRLTSALNPESVVVSDAVVAAVFTGWVLFFFIGIGPFNGIFKWAFSRREPTSAEEHQMPGKDQGLWPYFRYSTHHKVARIHDLVTLVVPV